MERRQIEQEEDYRNTVPNHGTMPPDPASFLSISANKANIIRLLQLYVAREETCLHITNDQWAEVAGLQSNQEEADTRIIVHVAHASAEGYRAVVVTPVVRSLRSIFCPDRDTPDKSTKLGTSLHKLFIIHSGWGCPG